MDDGEDGLLQSGDVGYQAVQLGAIPVCRRKEGLGTVGECNGSEQVASAGDENGDGTRLRFDDARNRVPPRPAFASVNELRVGTSESNLGLFGLVV
jgi:hypothetical protein